MDTSVLGSRVLLGCVHVVVCNASFDDDVAIPLAASASRISEQMGEVANCVFDLQY